MRSAAVRAATIGRPDDGPIVGRASYGYPHPTSPYVSWFLDEIAFGMGKFVITYIVKN